MGESKHLRRNAGDIARPKQSLADAGDRQDAADTTGEDPGRETARVGNTKKSYKDVKEAQGARQWERNGWKE